MRYIELCNVKLPFERTFSYHLSVHHSVADKCVIQCRYSKNEGVVDQFTCVAHLTSMHVFVATFAWAAICKLIKILAD